MTVTQRTRDRCQMSASGLVRACGVQMCDFGGRMSLVCRRESAASVADNETARVDASCQRLCNGKRRSNAGRWYRAVWIGCMGDGGSVGGSRVLLGCGGGMQHHEEQGRVNVSGLSQSCGWVCAASTVGVGERVLVWERRGIPVQAAKEKTHYLCGQASSVYADTDVVSLTRTLAWVGGGQQGVSSRTVD